MKKGPAKTGFFSSNCIYYVKFMLLQLWENITHNFHHNLRQPASDTIAQKSIEKHKE